MATTGIHAFLDLLAGFGVRHIFGNPGTTELPLNDALVGDRRIQYILGLQEVPVMAMADGYAMASRRAGRRQSAHLVAAWATRWACSTTPFAKGRRCWSPPASKTGG